MGDSRRRKVKLQEALRRLFGPRNTQEESRAKREKLFAPRNIQAEVERNPFLAYLYAMDSRPATSVIDHLGQFVSTENDPSQQQTLAGQRSFLRSDTLPRKINQGIEKFDEIKILESFGVKFLGPVKDDRLFQYIELPVGWTRISDEHPLWSYLVDENGRQRVTIFYKPDLHDRDAFMSVDRRFRYSFDFDLFKAEKVAVAHVFDGETVIYSTDRLVPTEGQERYEVREIVEKKALDWLNENYPDWKNPGAYWSLVIKAEV